MFFRSILRDGRETSTKYISMDGHALRGNCIHHALWESCLCNRRIPGEGVREKAVLMLSMKTQQKHVLSVPKRGARFVLKTRKWTCSIELFLSMSQFLHILLEPQCEAHTTRTCKILWFRATCSNDSYSTKHTAYMFSFQSGSLFMWAVLLGKRSCKLSRCWKLRGVVGGGVSEPAVEVTMEDFPYLRRICIVFVRLTRIQLWTMLLLRFWS